MASIDHESSLISLNRQQSQSPVVRTHRGMRETV